jgi:hypothetical protein
VCLRITDEGLAAPEEQARSPKNTSVALTELRTGFNVLALTVMNIREATAQYETWLGGETPLLRKDLKGCTDNSPGRTCTCKSTAPFHGTLSDWG